MGGKVLYVGCDESNHGISLKRRRKNIKGEILVAVFSVLGPDGVIVTRSKKRDRDYALNYVSQHGRDWRVTVRAGDQYNCQQNLSIVAPTLINDYLICQRKKRMSGLKEVRVSFDGEVSNNAKKNFRKDMSSIVGPGVSVFSKGFVKKKTESSGRVIKRYESPILVWVADSLASYLNKLSVEELFSHPKMIRPLIENFWDTF